MISVFLTGLQKVLPGSVLIGSCRLDITRSAVTLEVKANLIHYNLLCCLRLSAFKVREFPIVASPI